MSKPTENRFPRILLATDGSPAAQQAAEYAAQIAKGFDSKVTVLSAIPSISALAAPLEGEYYANLINKADDVADKATAVFKKAGVGVSQREVPQGHASVVETILDCANDEKTSLIVMGTRGLGGLRRAVLGSVSSAVAEHSSCATLVVRPRKRREQGGSIRKIVVAVDDSAYAQRALETAVAMAKRMKADLRIAHVVFVPSLFWSMGIPGSAVPTQKIEDDAEREGRKLLDKAVKYAKESGVSDLEEELVTDLVAPAQGIIQLAQHDRADVIVVGTRGNGGFRKLLLGSVANTLLHYAECSVLVTK